MSAMVGEVMLIVFVANAIMLMMIAECCRSFVCLLTKDNNVVEQ